MIRLLVPVLVVLAVLGVSVGGVSALVHVPRPAAVSQDGGGGAGALKAPKVPHKVPGARMLGRAAAAGAQQQQTGNGGQRDRGQRDGAPLPLPGDDGDGGSLLAVFP